MKPLKDCEFTAFISYAHADDTAWFNWVSDFRNELERSLGALLRMRLPRIHLSAANGPVAGVLSEELMKRVEASFAMIIVVHDNYAQSEWCLRELEYFKSLFGDEGLRQRLFIVALSESAMLGVSGGSAWKRLLPSDEQVWIPFYDPADHNRPLDVYMGPGQVSVAFRTPFERLRGDLAAKLKLALAANAAPATHAATAAEAVPPPARAAALERGVAAAAVAAPSVVFGFTPSTSAAAVAAVAAQLAQAGAAPVLLLQDAVFNEFADFDRAQHLVLPFDDTPAMLTTLAAGGHLQLQREAWLNKGRPAAGLHWLDLRRSPPPPAQWSGGAAYVASLGVPVASAEALLRQLLPQAAAAPPPAQSVRIYIESNHHERNLWEPLGEQIRLKWDELCRRLAPGRVPPLNLRARGLPVDQIDGFPSLDDADGVVLLWGRKTSEALVAQINKVENKLAPGRDAAPGIVAYLMPPQASSEPMPAWGWRVLRFDASDEQHIDVVAAERDELRAFLQKVYDRRQQLDQARAP